MHNFAADRHRSADVRPSRNLTNAEHVAVHEAGIGIGVADHGLADGDVLVLAQDLVAVLHDVAGKIGRLGVGAALESAGDFHQIAGGHVFRQQIFAGPLHLARDGHGRGIGLGQIAVNDDAVPGPEHDVVAQFAGQGLAEIDAEDGHAAIGFAAIDLRVSKAGVGIDTAGEIDGVAQSRLPVGEHLAGMRGLRR